MSILALVVAAISGIAMAIQGSLNSALSKVVGTLGGTFFVHLIGTVFAVLLLLIGVGDAKLTAFGQAPWYTYLGGLLSVAIVYGVMIGINNVGVCAATTAIIVGQISTSVVIDHFGLFGLEPVPFSMWKAGGVILMAISAWMLLHK